MIWSGNRSNPACCDNAFEGTLYPVYAFIYEVHSENYAHGSSSTEFISIGTGQFYAYQTIAHK